MSKYKKKIIRNSIQSIIFVIIVPFVTRINIKWYPYLVSNIGHAPNSYFHDEVPHGQERALCTGDSLLHSFLCFQNLTRFSFHFLQTMRSFLFRNEEKTYTALYYWKQYHILKCSLTRKETFISR